MKLLYTIVACMVIFGSWLNLAPAENVEFPDVNLANTVREALNLPADADIPKAQMATLTALDASEADISDLTGLEHATQLTALSLGVNQISDIGPLAGLIQLTALWLWNNQISDIGPLAGLTELTLLDLGNNQISDVTSLAGLTNLTVLSLRYNQISDVTALANLINLEEVYLAENPITDEAPLQTLLQANPDVQIDIEVPGPAWMPDRNLHDAVRAALGLTQGEALTPQALQALTQLEAPSHGISDLTGLEHATQLTTLDLADNHISDIAPLTGLTQLTLLSLGWNTSGNQISDIAPLAGLINLKGLYLDSNQIGDISPLAGLIQLTALGLWNNQISDIGPLAGLSELIWLDLEDNQITDVTALANLINLEELYLRENPIADKALLITLLEKNPDLQLDIEPIDDPGAAWMPDPGLRAYVREALGLTPIEPLTQQALQGLTSLNFITVSHRIGDLTGLEHALQLTELEMESNEISDLSPLADLTKLTRLNLRNNSISNISHLTGLTQLTTLDLTRNEISDLSPLAELTQLIELKIGWNNAISDISPLEQLTQLTVLGLATNDIYDITPLTGLTNLTELHLGGNRIRDITSISGLTQLTWLGLSGNDISDITAIAGLTELTYLSLEFNEISDVNSLTGLTNLEQLWLAGNPIMDKIIEDQTPLNETPLWDVLQKNPNMERYNTDIPIDETLQLTLFEKNLEINAGIPLYDIVSFKGSFPSFSPDGILLAYVALDDSDGSTVKLWDVATKQNSTTLAAESDVSSIIFSPDGRLLASVEIVSDENGDIGGSAIQLWDVATKQKIATLEGAKGFVMSASFSPDGRLLASVEIVSDDNDNIVSTIRLWDVATKQNTITFEVLGPASTSSDTYGELVFSSLLLGKPSISISFSQDGSLLILTSIDGTVGLWDVTTKENIALFEGAPGINNLSLSQDRTLLAYGSSDGIKLWNVETRENIATLSEEATSVSLSPDGTLLAYTASDALKLWNMETKETVTLSAEWYLEDLTHLSFSPDSAMLIAAGTYYVSLWDVESGSLTALLEGISDLSFASVTFSPDGSLLATKALLDEKLILWDLTSYRAPSDPEKIAEDVNGDGIVNIQDLVLVAASLGKTGPTSADVNADGVVDIRDLVKVAGALGTAAAAPSLDPEVLDMFTAATVQKWLSQAQQLDLTDIKSQRGIHFLEQLLAALIPKETALLPNYPNPFNPETWIPYQLATSADVTLTIYAVNGQVVRQLALGHQLAGTYQNKNRAAYWDGRNAVGESVASGLYFYTLTVRSPDSIGTGETRASEFTATRKMLIRK